MFRFSCYFAPLMGMVDEVKSHVTEQDAYGTYIAITTDNNIFLPLTLQ